MFKNPFFLMVVGIAAIILIVYAGSTMLPVPNPVVSAVSEILP